MPRGESSPPPSEPDLLSNDRLESWKEIAAFLGRGVTTVQRWEAEEGLPVHRLPHAKKGSVFASKRELESWRSSRVRAKSPRPIHEGASFGALGALEPHGSWLRRPIVWL